MIILRFDDFPEVLDKEDIGELIDISVTKGTSLNTLCTSLNSEELSFYVS